MTEAEIVLKMRTAPLSIETIEKLETYLALGSTVYHASQRYCNALEGYADAADPQPFAFRRAERWAARLALLQALEDYENTVEK